MQYMVLILLARNGKIFSGGLNLNDLNGKQKVGGILGIGFYNKKGAGGWRVNFELTWRPVIYDAQIFVTTSRLFQDDITQEEHKNSEATSTNYNLSASINSDISENSLFGTFGQFSLGGHKLLDIHGKIENESYSKITKDTRVIAGYRLNIYDAQDDENWNTSHDVFLQLEIDFVNND